MSSISLNRLCKWHVALAWTVVALGANLNEKEDVQIARDEDASRYEDEQVNVDPEQVAEVMELGPSGEVGPQKTRTAEHQISGRPLMRSAAQGDAAPLSLSERQQWEVDADAQTEQLRVTEKTLEKLQREAEEEAPRLLNHLHMATRERVNHMASDSQKKDQELPDDSIIEGLRKHHVLDFSEAADHPTALLEGEAQAEESAESDMVPGMNAADLAYKAMDLLYGTSGIIPEDYPYACICGAAGVCEGDTMKTTCKGRIGSGSGAQRMEGSLVSILFIGVLAALNCGHQVMTL